ncbi:MAG TPA: glycosyltransferase family 4 protein [Anaerolineae bacterium]|nr:glycosyltransferase family 4 protein [Anaerolineae bacterium]
MRILMVAHTFLPESRGGMENHAFYLSKYLLSAGHEVGVLYRVRSKGTDPCALDTGQWEGLRVFRLMRGNSAPGPVFYPFYDPRAEGLFERVLQTFQPEVVHFHHLVDLSASLVSAAARHGIPTVFTLHDFWPMCIMSHLRTPDGDLCHGPDEGLRCAECLWKQQAQAHAPVSIRTRYRELGLRESLRRAPRFVADVLFARLAGGSHEFSNANLRVQMASLPWRNSYMRQALTSCTQLISPSRFLMEKYVEWGVPASHFLQIYNSVPGSLRSLRSLPRGVHDRVRFGFLGSLYPPKGVHVLIEAFRQMGSSAAELHIWGAAPNPGAQPYADQVHEQGRDVPSLCFEGGFPPADLGRILQDLDVLVVPSTWYENNPLVILEAFAAGIPVIAGDIGGMAELVQPNVNGLLFRVGDPGDLASRMSMMLDPARLEQCRGGTPVPASHDELGATVERVYRGLLEDQEVRAPEPAS